MTHAHRSLVMKDTLCAGSQLKITIIHQVGYFGHHPRHTSSSASDKNLPPRCPTRSCNTPSLLATAGSRHRKFGSASPPVTRSPAKKSNRL